MEPRKRRRFALILVLLAILVGGGLSVFLTDVIAPRGPRPEDDEWVELTHVPNFGDHLLDSGEGDSGKEGTEDGTPDGNEEEEEGYPPLDRESKWELLGEVLDHEGKPVAAEIFVERLRVGRIPLGSVKTGKEGSFHAFLPEAGEYVVTADRDGTRISQGVAIEGAEGTVVATLTFPGAATIHGSVRTAFGPLAPDIRGPEPVPGQEPVLVDLIPVAGGESLESLIDEDGRYRISGAAAGEHFLRVRSKWFVTRVTLGAEEEKAVDIVLPAGRIHGRVTDATTGKAAEGVQVVLKWVGTGGALTGDHAKAGFTTVSDRCAPDESGDYSFDGLPPGSYVLFSNGHWYDVVRGEASLAEGRMEARVDFPLEAGSVVVLTITDEEGKPVERPFCGTQGISWGFTGHVSGLKAETSEFIAGGDGYEFQRQMVAFKPGEETPATFQLAKQAATRLVFVDPDGRTVAGVRVTVPWGDYDIQKLSGIYRRGTSLPLTDTDAEGGVWIYGVRAGPVTVRARCNGFEAFEAEVVLPEGGGEVKATLTPGDVTWDIRLVVTRLAPDGPAAKRGVKTGDVIRAVDGNPVTSAQELAAAIGAAKKAGAKAIRVTVEQGGREVVLEFSPGTLGVSLEQRYE